MLTRDDLIDIILERLGKPFPGPGQASPESSGPPIPSPVFNMDQEARGRPFLSEYDIRKRLTANFQELRIPMDAIISPLALEWLTLRRIKIVRE